MVQVGEAVLVVVRVGVSTVELILCVDTFDAVQDIDRLRLYIINYIAVNFRVLLDKMCLFLYQSSPPPTAAFCLYSSVARWRQAARQRPRI